MAWLVIRICEPNVGDRAFGQGPGNARTVVTVQARFPNQFLYGKT